MKDEGHRIAKHSPMATTEGLDMPITVKVQPDLSAFRSATPEEVTEVLEACGLQPSAATPNGHGAALTLLERFTILPKY